MGLNNNKKIVITGLGTVTPIGLNIDEYWKNLLAGVSGIDKITKFDASDYSTQIAGELKNFNTLDYMDAKLVRRTDSFNHYSIAATQLALEDGGLSNGKLDKLDKDRIGVLIGSGIGGIKTFQDNVIVHKEKGYKKISPFFIPSLISNMASGMTAILHGLRGPNYSISTACATSNHTLSESFHILQRGDADMMVVGGTESPITDLAVGGFIAARALSSRNDEPKKASRPFDVDRDGFIMSEGSGVLILETEEHAIKRGAKIYAQLIGSGMSSDAYHMTAPCEDGSGAALSMINALRNANIEPCDVDYINTHGTSTQLGDIAEQIAIKNVFGDHAKKMKLNATKSLTGHLLGAAGAIEAITTVKSIETSTIHHTLNLDNPDPQCDLELVTGKPIKHDINYAFSNSFGFGGHNCTLVFKKYES